MTSSGRLRTVSPNIATNSLNTWGSTRADVARREAHGLSEHELRGGDAGERSDYVRREIWRDVA